ncbi:MAG: T9SS type A sorting domain-containing protein [Saprospiraceae bacterium]|nr:T9SS type A sorting domain-containing protein [Saprospiraceae bacterium]MBK7794860.1 T9SS type A sorting domain-containing protein [Saprospiraceae bacterium]
MNHSIFQSGFRITFCICFILNLQVGNKLIAQHRVDPFDIMAKESFDKIPLRKLVKQGSERMINPESKTSTSTAKLNFSALRQLLQSSSHAWKTELKLPTQKSKSELILKEYTIIDPEMSVFEDDGQSMQKIEIGTFKTYKGFLENDPYSMVNLCVTEDAIFGTILSSSGKNFSIFTQSLPSSEEATLVISEDKLDKLPELGSICGTDDYRHYIESENILNTRLRDNCKKVGITIRTDYDLYRSMRSTFKITSYIFSLFNSVHSIYRKEDIQLSITEIIVNTAPDGFKHISSNEDLDYARAKWPNYNGNLTLLISGFSKSNAPALGGVAYVNSLCYKSYSFAFANVIGSFLNYPTYSWDTYVTAHEIGHVLGSRHTHACVWGPQKNKALDNCYSPEGSCAPVENSSTKGTLMSYCHLTGRPGIDFTLGLGQEPGDVIRNKVRSSSCLGNYIPTANTLVTANTEVYANLECTDGSYTHYYFDNNTIEVSDDILIASIAKNSQNIGSVTDGSLIVMSATTLQYGSKYGTSIQASYCPINMAMNVINKYWQVNSKYILNKPISVKIAFNKQDFADLQGIKPDLKEDELKLFTLQSPALVDPASNHANSTPVLFTEYQYSKSSATSKMWKYNMVSDNQITGEFSMSKSGGIGIGFWGKPLPAFQQFNSLEATKTSTSNRLTIKSTHDNTTKRFVIERSIDGFNFDSISFVFASSSPVYSTKTYYCSDFRLSAFEVYYRIKAVQANGRFEYSKIISLSSSYNSNSTAILYPNPNRGTEAVLEYSSTAAKKALIEITDYMGTKLRYIEYNVSIGKNYIAFPLENFSEGVYYVNIINETPNIQLKFIVDRGL